MSSGTKKVIPLRPGSNGGARAPFNPQSLICEACDVRRHALFGALDAQGLDRIHYHIADISIEPGEQLFGVLEHGSAAFTLREGVVRLERSSERGNRRIVRLAGRGDLVGLEALLGQSYTADAVACTPVKACRLPRVLVDELARDQPELLRDLMRRWQRALDDADEWLTEMSTGGARWRMLRLLLKLSEFGAVEPGGTGLVWLPARSEMGAMLDMTIETASRLVSALRREQVLDLPDARHARLDMARLMAALKDEAAQA
jgi:CRP/FNR family transcriptional regulator, anaerobic regulatory protein